MFVCVTSYLKAVFCHRPLELDCSSGMTSLHSSAGQRQIYPTLPTWHLPWVVALPWHLVPSFLCLIPSRCLSCLSGAETKVISHWDGVVLVGKAGQGDWQDLDTVSNPWGMLICAWVIFLIKFSQQVHPGLRMQTAQSRDYRSLCFYTHQGTCLMPYL